MTGNKTDVAILEFMKDKIFKLLSAISLVSLLSSCSPMKSSPKEEKHQMELTLHELQTNLDDMRHDLNCFQTELQIMDGKIKNQEDATQNIKQQHVERIQNKVEYLSRQFSGIDKKINIQEKKHFNIASNIKNLSSHANETNLALKQHKEKINELESTSLSQDKRLNEVSELKTTLKALVKTIRSHSSNFIIYKVKPRDSLEKIAKKNQVSVDSIKRLNDLDDDLIVIGQELKIPHS